MLKYNDYELHEMFDEFLDSSEQDVQVMGMTYSVSQIIKAVDPIAYRVGFSDWLSFEECSDCNNCLEDCSCEEYYCQDCGEGIEDIYQLCNDCADNYDDNGELIEKEEVKA